VSITCNEFYGHVTQLPTDPLYFYKTSAIRIDGGKDITVDNNKIHNNQLGINIQEGTNLTIENNQVYENVEGIVVKVKDSYGDGETAGLATLNSIYDNGDYGLKNLGDDSFDATLNWWGDLSGPAHASNPDGNGNAVSDNVNYEPWLGGNTELELLGGDVNYYIDSDGRILEVIVATSDDGDFTFTIPEGTIALDEFGDPLPGIDVSTGNGIEPPENADFVGLIYNWEPEGATFDPYIIFEFHYDDEDIPIGFEETNLVIMYYDSDAEEWVALESFVDTLNNIVTAYVTHFTSFSLFSVETEIETTTIVSTITNTTTRTRSNETVTITVTRTMLPVTTTFILPGTTELITQPVTMTQTGIGTTLTQTDFKLTTITSTQQGAMTTTTTTQTIPKEIINWPITIVIAVVSLLFGALLVAIIIRRT
jgi:parallel beta-helix repeat protein